MAQGNHYVQKTAVAFDEEAPRPAPNSNVAGSQWLARTNRTHTNPQDTVVESRPFRHAHVLRRPHTMQHYNSREGSSSSASLSKTESNGSKVSREGRSTDNVLVQLARIDLFIDLIWVGIVANLSATLGEQLFSNRGVSIGEAIMEYILLFLPVWRIWDSLREYGSNFYKDDIVQRLFMVWVLTLSVLYGVNAPYAYVPEGKNSLKLLIVIYLIARGSFLAAYAFQSIFLAFLRRQVLVTTVTAVATSSLWITAIYVNYPGKVGLLVAANFAEHPIAMYMASPYSDRLLTGGWEKKTDYEHYIERIEGFFIIILGEGVFRLIEGSPSGIGLTHRAGTVLTALLLYYVLHWIYFNGDQSKEFVHALKRRWWKGFLWKYFHVQLFGTLLILAASVLFLVENDYVVSNGSEPATSKTGTESPEEVVFYVRRAIWSASASLAVSFATMTAIAILNLPLDKPNTLIINSRWTRLAPRAPALAAICCLPLFPRMSGAKWAAGATITLYIVFLWEWMAGMERDWKVLEPKKGDDTQ